MKNVKDLNNFIIASQYNSMIYIIVLTYMEALWLEEKLHTREL